MICYRDRTYCPYWETCRDAGPCSRKLTEDVKKAAEDLGLPICQFAEKPHCYREKEIKGTK